jgi:serine/threonine protein kinase
METLGGGRYQVVGVLGHGGMGTVYHCRDTEGEREVAVKELVPPSGRAALDRVEQFRQEARILASLRHPHLPRVYDAFEENERHYLVMERVLGQTLRQWVETHGRAPQALAIHWLDGILDVVDFLHRQDPPILFRDISPDNVMVDGSEQGLWLIDFGLARLLLPAERTRPALRGWGSPSFAAPEHYTQAGTLPASDLYGVAATGYWLFVGDPPPEAVQRLIGERRLGVLEKTVRRPLYEWIRRGMELEVDRRFASAEEMRMGLMRAAHAPTAIAPVGPALYTMFRETLERRLKSAGWTIEATPPEPFSIAASRRVDLRLFHGFCWTVDPLDEHALHHAAVLARQHALRRKSLLPSTLFFTAVGTRVPDPEAVALAAAESSNPSAGLRAIILLHVDLGRGCALDAHVPAACRNSNDPGDFVLNVRIAAGGGTAIL